MSFSYDLQLDRIKSEEKFIKRKVMVMPKGISVGEAVSKIEASLDLQGIHQKW